MKSTYSISILISITLLVIYLLHAFNLCRFVIVRSISNEPTLSRNSVKLSSSLVKPSLFKFAVFKNEKTLGNRWIFRICGMPGDTIKIKSGHLYINGFNRDSNLSLSHSYKVSIRDTFGLNVVSYSYDLDLKEDSLIVTLPDDFIQQQFVSGRLYYLPSYIPDKAIQKVYQKLWNRDNFGPTIVPQNCVFLLGDNRDGSLDSRYIGFIEFKDIEACLIF